MNNSQKIEAIKSEIIKNDESILELKFGCKFIIEVYDGCRCGNCSNDYRFTECFIIGFEEREHLGNKDKYFEENGIERDYYECLEVVKHTNPKEFHTNKYSVRKNQIKKIIGRDINWIDILRITKNKLGTTWQDNKFWIVKETGDLFEFDLTKSVDLQPEPTINCLYDLIVKNK